MRTSHCSLAKARCILVKNYGFRRFRTEELPLQNNQRTFILRGFSGALLKMAAR
jgi:hypothetical protein